MVVIKFWLVVILIQFLNRDIDTRVSYAIDTYVSYVIDTNTGRDKYQRTLYIAVWRICGDISKNTIDTNDTVATCSTSAKMICTIDMSFINAVEDKLLS